MSEENPSVTEEVPASAETPVSDTPVAEAPVVPPPSTEEESPASEVSALAPGGDRFKQVWARAKTAEAKLQEQAAELQRERETRIRLEERTKVQEETKVANTPIYTWDQLEGFINEGKLTRAQAADYREKIVREEAVKEARRQMESELQTTSHKTTVASELDRYKRAVPEVLTPGTPERIKVEREFAYLTQTLGYAPTLATELAATRAALGDADTVERSAQARRTTTKESYPETHSSQQKPQPKGPDVVGKLSPREKAHYEKMIQNGRYRGWDEVRDELLWEKPAAGTLRG